MTHYIIKPQANAHPLTRWRIMRVHSNSDKKEIIACSGSRIDAEHVRACLESHAQAVTEQNAKT